MTPAEHLAKAEKLLTVAMEATPATAGPWVQSNAYGAIAHALIAIGAQLGVPHQHLAGGGGDTDAAHL